MLAVQVHMKRDGRKISRQALEEMRCMTYDRVVEGEYPTEVSASFGFHRSWAYKVRAKVRGYGKRVLHHKDAPGRPRKLTSRQEQQVFRWVNGNNPRQYGFDFGLGSGKSCVS